MNIFHLYVVVVALLLGLFSVTTNTLPTSKDVPSIDKDTAGEIKQGILIESDENEDGMNGVAEGKDGTDEEDENTESVDPPFVHTKIIRMDKVIPEENDMYACAGVSLSTEQSWIVGYVPLPQNESVDAMTVYGCLEEPSVSNTAWSCNPHIEKTVCSGPSSIIYSWSRSCDMIGERKQQVLIVGGAYIRDIVLMVHYKDGDIQDSSALELKLLSGEYTETDAHYLSRYYSQFVDPLCDEKLNDLGRLLETIKWQDESYDATYDYDDSSQQLNLQDNRIGTSFDETYSSSWGYDPELVQDLTWPAPNVNLGQVTGVDAKPDTGDVFVFHRGERTWQLSDFDENNIFINGNERGPIEADVLLLLSKRGGYIKEKAGADRFYMPHGLTCDYNGDLWLTDVALHQVFKVSGKTFKTEMTLGEAFVPGEDHHHFCKPTDVAVDKATGNVFVADGYCNKRVLKFSSNGTFLQEIKAHNKGLAKSNFNIPHSLAIVESRRMICVADRENGRIQCFNTITGDFIHEIEKREFGGQVFAIAYDRVLDVMYAVNGLSERIPTQGYTLDIQTGEILETWAPPQGFQMPHDIAVGPDGNYVYVADVINEGVFRFLREDNNM
ncbi:peptidyl-glycine alpha-amidating monooxygenase B-like [Antedon mediterranea]|uniref:peptidyl-glycine alpha-amidating monooxygenase B-like n=1 Tax=Antedon mediterranea TaxID=105859 RepID=UPI003AF482F5